MEAFCRQNSCCSANTLAYSTQAALELFRNSSPPYWSYKFYCRNICSSALVKLLSMLPNVLQFHTRKHLFNLISLEKKATILLAFTSWFQDCFTTSWNPECLTQTLRKWKVLLPFIRFDDRTNNGAWSDRPLVRCVKWNNLKAEFHASLTKILSSRCQTLPFVHVN